MPDAPPASERSEKTVAFVVARLSSSRLPSKHLRPVGNRPLLQWVIDRLKECRELDDIVLATVNEKENLPLKEFASENDIACFWYEGEVDHVTTRLRSAAESCSANICVLVSGDCPLIHAPGIDQAIRELIAAPRADTVRLIPDSPERSQGLQGIVVNRLRAWQLADDLADRPELKEHQFPLLWHRPELFHTVDAQMPSNCCMTHHRLSVDTLADVDFMNAVYNALTDQQRPFRLPEVIDLLEKRPGLKKINTHVHQCRLVENKKRVLFVVDAGGGYGFGHITRCLALARQMTERLAWSTHFLVDDRKVRAMVAQTGCKTLWGAFGRMANRDGDHLSKTIEAVIGDYDLLVIDIFDQRGPEGDWRAPLPKDVGCVVIENRQPWTRYADMIVVPNMLDKHGFSDAADPPIDVGTAKEITGPKIVGGDRFIILRNEIRQLASQKVPKEIDVLAYLHDPDRRATIRDILGRCNLKSVVVDGFEPDFPETLAKARVYISGFGISFNEALALGTVPVCWPDSKAHRDDAERFYAHLGLGPLIVETPAEIETMIPDILNQRDDVLPTTIQDGTPNIVAEIAAFFDPSRH